MQPTPKEHPCFCGSTTYDVEDATLRCANCGATWNWTSDGWDLDTSTVPREHVPDSVDLEATARVNATLNDLLPRLVNRTGTPYEALVVTALLMRIVASAAARDMPLDEARDLALQARDVAHAADIDEYVARLMVAAPDAGGDA
jgi:hypothetical protein